MHVTYVLKLPASPSYTGRGLRGFQFTPLQNQEVDIHFVDVTTGHDTFLISKKITRIYYVLDGHGHFTIADQKYDVEPGVLVEVPPIVEYSYSGTMKLLLIGTPRWFEGNEKFTKRNPDVSEAFSLRHLFSKLARLWRTI
jgi:mannose-6-phosphate isomerase-like protein (cupin superfamily)